MDLAYIFKQTLEESCPKNCSPWNELGFALRKCICHRQDLHPKTHISQLASLLLSFCMQFNLFLQYLWAFWHLHLAGPMSLKFCKLPWTWHLLSGDEHTGQRQSNTKYPAEQNPESVSRDLDSNRGAAFPCPSTAPWIAISNTKPRRGSAAAGIYLLLVGICGFFTPLVCSFCSCKCIYYKFNLFHVCHLQIMMFAIEVLIKYLNIYVP